MEQKTTKINKLNKKNLYIVIFINLIIFVIANLIFNVKYEQVDDFIIYNLYSGLDGTFNIHGVYIYPFICMVLSSLYKLIFFINWHSIFLLSMQFICFTIIGYIILNKQNNKISVFLYTIFASVFYTSLLMLLQYTSVASLIIFTALMIIINELSKEKLIKKNIMISCILFILGIMLRIQSLLIVVPFFIIYLFTLFFDKTNRKEHILKLLIICGIYAMIVIFVYLSNFIFYTMNPVYKNYQEYNEIRTALHDIAYVDYEENKEIFDEIGWSKNDHYLFYTFNFGDENKYSKENLEKILEYKINKDGKYNFDTSFNQIIEDLSSQMINTNTYISILFFTVFLISLYTNSKKSILIFLTTIGVNIIFIILNRSMLRVVIPEYIIGTALMIYNLNFANKEFVDFNQKKIITIFLTIIITSIFAGNNYLYNYDSTNYTNYQQLINYTNDHKENVFLYTVPSLQDRYLAYNVYQMPPKSSFSNLRVMGGWDMFTENYYDFKERYLLDGTFLDLLKDNVYLVDGEVVWSGRTYINYKENIILALKENYNIDAKCEKVQEFGNLSIYKVQNNDS